MLISYLVLKGIGGQGPQLENEQRKNAVEILTCKIMSESVSSGSKGSEWEGSPVRPGKQGEHRGGGPRGPGVGASGEVEGAGGAVQS